MCAVDLIVTQFVQSGVDNLVRDFNIIGSRADTVEGKLQRMGTMGIISAGAGAGLAAGMIAFGKAAIDAGGQMQQIEAGFTAMLGSPEAAKAQIADLQAFAARSPFDFIGSAQAAQRLMAMGVAARDVIPYLDSVGNAVAAAGGTQDTLDGVLRAIGQIQTKGRLSQEELNQMAERGVNMTAVYAALQSKLGLTADQMQNIGAQAIPASKALPIIVEALGNVAGGKGMATQMETLPGKLSMVGDAWNQLLAETSKDLMPTAGATADKITALLNGLTAFEQAHPGIVKTGAAIGALGATVATGYGLWLKYQSVIGLVRIAKEGLRTATVADNAAEIAKTATAGGEAAALEGVAEGATVAAEQVGFLSAQAFGLSGAAALGLGVAAVGVTAYGISETIAGIKNAQTLSDEELRKKGPLGELQASGGAALGSGRFGAFMEGDLANYDRGDAAEKEAIRLGGLSHQRSLNRRFMDEQRAQAAPGYGEGGAGLGYYAGGNPAAPAVLARQQRAANARNKTTVTVSVDNPYTPADEDFDDRNSHSLYG